MSKEKATLKVNNEIGSSASASKKKLSPFVIIVPAVVLAVVVGIAVIMYIGDNTDANVVVTPDNVQAVIAAMKEEDKTPMGSFETAMTTEWHFPDVESASPDAYVENSVANRSTIYFTITFRDTDEEIYKSPYIPVGSSLANITLDYPLEAGSHDMVLTYHLVDDAYNETSQVSVGLTIIIEN